jgi:diadenosine tetraphosphate (Ap4A) HIT family hydrolase
VHFHIIPKPDEKTGLGIRWNTGQVDPVRAADLARRISADLARESSAAS